VAEETLDALFERYRRQRDERAVAELVRRTRPRLLAVARRIGAPQDAEDAVQTAYLSLIHRREDPMEAPVQAWLMTAVVRIAYGLKATLRRQVALAERLARIPDAEPVAAGAIREEEARDLRRRVDTLPGHYRDAVVLHYFQGLSTEETALLLDVGRDAVKKRLERARALLRLGLHPRLGMLLLAGPWLFSDAAAAATAGGLLVMKKKALVLVALLALGAGTAGVFLQRNGSPAAPRTVIANARPGGAEPSAGAGQPAPVADTPPAPEHGFFGVVVDEAQAPVAGAVVELREHWRANGGDSYLYVADKRIPPMRSAVADAEGHFRLEPLLAGEFVALGVHVVAPAYARAVAKVERDRGARIVLAPGGIVRVAVLDENGPIEGARVALVDGTKPLPEDAWSRLETILDDAPASLDLHLSPGKYRFRAFAPGHAPEDTEVIDLARGDERALEVRLGRGVVAEVTVVDPEGAPVAGASVLLAGFRGSFGEATTAADGRCSIAGIVPSPRGDTIHYRVKAESHATALRWLRIAPGPGTEQIRIELEPGVPVEVVARDEAGPLAGVQVTITPEASNPLYERIGYATTDATGIVRFERVAAGNFQLSLRLPTGWYETRRIEVARAPVRETFEIASREATILGAVLRPDGQPATAGEARFVQDGDREPARAPLDAAGTFRIDGAKVGPGRIGVVVPGFALQEWPLTGRAGEQRGEWRLEAGSRVSGRVVTRAGEPVGGIDVLLLRPHENGWEEAGETRSGADGSFAMDGLGAGKYHLRPRRGEWIESCGLGLGVRGGDRDVRVVVKPASEGYGLALDLFVTDARDGSPVDVPLRIQYTLDGQPGRWHLEPKAGSRKGHKVLTYYDAPGTADFRFTAPGYRPCAVKGVRIEDRKEHQPIEIRLDPGATLRLRVLDPDGEPLRATTIYTRGERPLRTDDQGEVDLSGLEPGRQPLFLKIAEPYVYADLKDVAVPGRLDVTLLRHGHVEIRHPLTWGQLRASARWQLALEDGTVIDESKQAASDWSPETPVRTTLRSPHAGKHRVIAEIDGHRTEAAVTVVPGETVAANPGSR
jgi:RNA polymerase sigma-70 factor (ECF subfamily)